MKVCRALNRYWKRPPPLVPSHGTLADVREAAAHCKACPLWQRGTQTVFGEGNAHARMMLVGEQPGNDEDLAGHPFIGPAGKFWIARSPRPVSSAGLHG